MANSSYAVPIKTQAGEFISGKMSATAIKRGWMCNYNSSGYVVKASDTSGETFAGIAMEDVDNSAGSAGDKNIQLYFGPFEVLSGETETQASEGIALRYVQYNSTVAAVGTTTHDVLVGLVIGFVDSTHVIVDPRRKTTGIGT